MLGTVRRVESGDLVRLLQVPVLDQSFNLSDRQFHAVRIERAPGRNQAEQPAILSRWPP